MKAIKPIIFMLLTVLSFQACVEKIPDYNSFTIKLAIDSQDSIPLEDLRGIEVILSNQTKGYSLSQTINDSGIVVFSNIEPDFYYVTTSGSFSEGGSVFYVNGSKQIKVFESVYTDTLDVFLSESGALVIKQFYYSACLTEAGKQYSSDQFIEIHNNTDQAVYADGVSILEHESYSLDDPYWGWMEDTLVFRMVWSIPGDGDDVLIQPGESIVIARDGINHQDPVLGNPLCPVNLEFADFEFWVASASGADLDAPYAKNMVENLVTFRGIDIAFHTRGGSAIALAYIPGTQEERQEFIDTHLTYKLSSPDRYYAKIPIEYILDAVEVTWDEEHAVYKRFPIELDAGYTYVSEGSKSGKCIKRKVKEVVNGRFVYQDTNNSSNDFDKDVIPNPWVNEE